MKNRIPHSFLPVLIICSLSCVFVSCNFSKETKSSDATPKELTALDVVEKAILTAGTNEKWKNMVSEKELGGVQLFAENNWKSQFILDYGINGIPRFILIDPEGKIVDANAPRPSNPAILNLFKELKI